MNNRNSTSAVRVKLLRSIVIVRGSCSWNTSKTFWLLMI